jgi:hypothetical protein
LKVPPGKAPLKVNSDAGRAENLDADKLDEWDSSDFVRKGIDAGGDLYGTYPNPQVGHADNAGDANTLDGLDSSELQGSRGYAHINADGTLDASRSKNVNRSLRLSAGVYCVNSTFNPSSVVATIYAFSGPGMITQAAGASDCIDASRENYNMQVYTFNIDGTRADKAFDVAVN